MHDFAHPLYEYEYMQEWWDQRYDTHSTQGDTCNMTTKTSSRFDEKVLRKLHVMFVIAKNLWESRLAHQIIW